MICSQCGGEKRPIKKAYCHSWHMNVGQCPECGTWGVLREKCGPREAECLQPQSGSPLESRLLAQLRDRGLPEPEREYQFNKPTSRHKFDFAWPALMLAVEVEGATWIQGRHTRGGGYRNDCIKYNIAARLGWTLLRYTADMLAGGKAADEIAQVVRKRSVET